ncbi:acyl-CoA dehydrogenase, partial [Cryobacterium sp. 10I1]|nr:acyl-CoA dehydrogenase [Cryobacterium sp. 10I1]
MTASGRPTPLVASPLVDSVFDLDDLLAPEEVVWSRKARAFATNRILPTIEQDFEDRFFRAELVPEL